MPSTGKRARRSETARATAAHEDKDARIKQLEADNEALRKELKAAEEKAETIDSANTVLMMQLVLIKRFLSQIMSGFADIADEMENEEEAAATE